MAAPALDRNADLNAVSSVPTLDPWKHRSDSMRCKSCIWFVPKVPSAERLAEQGYQPNAKVYDLGRCRRHAPTMGGYPVVYVNDWCGDHRIDENKL